MKHDADHGQGIKYGRINEIRYLNEKNYGVGSIVDLMSSKNS